MTKLIDYKGQRVEVTKKGDFWRARVQGTTSHALSNVSEAAACNRLRELCPSMFKGEPYERTTEAR